jgi:dolichol-phosphate mannosyltransferase
MDADFSHSPDQIIDLIRPLESGQADLVIGSRYIDKGAIGKWPWYRRLASKSATLMARPFTCAEDPMSGFVFFKRRVIESVSLNPIGFKIGLEILAKGKYEKLLEVPITFQNRLHGESKLTQRVMLDYAKQLWQLLWEVETTIGQFVKFCLVGVSGLLVNMAVYSVGIYFLRFHYIPASVLAFSVAVCSNFFLNRRWTFKQTRKKDHSTAVRFGRFILVSLGGLAVNLLVLSGAIEMLHVHELPAQILAIFAATLFNFAGSKRWAFQS